MSKLQITALISIFVCVYHTFVGWDIGGDLAILGVLYFILPYFLLGLGILYGNKFCIYIAPVFYLLSAFYFFPVFLLFFNVEGPHPTYPIHLLFINTTAFFVSVMLVVQTILEILRNFKKGE